MRFKTRKIEGFVREAARMAMRDVPRIHWLLWIGLVGCVLPLMWPKPPQEQFLTSLGGVTIAVVLAGLCWLVQNFKPRWVQVRLRTLFLATLVLSIPIHNYAEHRRRVWFEKQFISAVESLGGSVSVHPNRYDKPLVYVSFTNIKLSDADFIELSRMPGCVMVTHIDLCGTSLTLDGLRHVRSFRSLRHVQIDGRPSYDSSVPVFE